MRLPGGDKAIVDDQKLAGYCLDPDHPRGKHKARVFAQALGFTAENAEELREHLLAAAAEEDATPTGSDQYGERFVIESTVTGPKGPAVVRSSWILRMGEDTPRLTSCYVK